MKVLLAIPHVFSPKEGSLYSSQTETKRSLKQQALIQATIGNLNRHRRRHWIHASLGKNQPVVNRELSSPDGVELTIRLFTPPGASLADALPSDPDLERLDPGVNATARCHWWYLATCWSKPRPTTWWVTWKMTYC